MKNEIQKPLLIDPKNESRTVSENSISVERIIKKREKSSS